MSEKTVQKVKLAASELMYSPNGLIRALRSRRTGTIGFCYPVPLDYTNPYIAMMFDGVRAGAEESNFDVLIYGNRGKQPGNLEPAVFLDGRIDGLVFWPGLGPPILDRLSNAGLPTVALLTTEVPRPFGYSATDEFQAAETALNHLIAMGHRRFVYAAGNLDYFHLARRRDAFLKAASAMRLAAVTVIDGSVADAGLRLIEMQSSSEHRFTAVVCAFDNVAFNLAARFESQGIRVPHDVSLVSFEGVASGSREDAITTLRQPIREIGRAAAHNLKTLINGARPSLCRTLFPAELIVGRATAPVLVDELGSDGNRPGGDVVTGTATAVVNG